MDLNIVVISLSHLLQQMLVLCLHIFICLANGLEENKRDFSSLVQRRGRKWQLYQRKGSTSNSVKMRRCRKKKILFLFIFFLRERNWEDTSISEMYVSDSRSLLLIDSVSSKTSLCFNLT